MAAPLALQLYTVRSELSRDFAGVVRRVAKAGYLGVETAGFPGTTPEQAATLFRELGLEVPAMHTALPLDDQESAVLDAAAAVGSKRVVGNVRPETKTVDGIHAMCDRVNRADAVAREHGLTLGLHNHDWEFELVEGRTIYDRMLEWCGPSVFFEVDTYWVKVGGADPAALVKRLGARAPLLHIKDGPGNKTEPQVAVGDGILDWPKVIKAAGRNAQWLIVELDACATDMLAAVEKSSKYLMAKGLGRGRKG